MWMVAFLVLSWISDLSIAFPASCSITPSFMQLFGSFTLDFLTSAGGALFSHFDVFDFLYTGCRESVSEGDKINTVPLRSGMFSS